MKLDEIKEKVISGELTVKAHNLGEATRRLSVYSKTKGETIMGKFYGDFESFRTIKYPKIIYMAEYPDYSGYRISKKVFKELEPLSNNHKIKRIIKTLDDSKLDKGLEEIFGKLKDCVSCTDNIIK